MQVVETFPTADKNSFILQSIPWLVMTYPHQEPWELQTWHWPNSIAILQADSRFAPSQWETVLQCSHVSHWLGKRLKSALYQCIITSAPQGLMVCGYFPWSTHNTQHITSNSLVWEHLLWILQLSNFSPGSLSFHMWYCAIRLQVIPTTHTRWPTIMLNLMIRNRNEICHTLSANFKTHGIFPFMLYNNFDNESGNS